MQNYNKISHTKAIREHAKKRGRKEFLLCSDWNFFSLKVSLTRLRSRPFVSSNKNLSLYRASINNNKFSHSSQLRKLNKKKKKQRKATHNIAQNYKKEKFKVNKKIVNYLFQMFVDPFCESFLLDCIAFV